MYVLEGRLDEMRMQRADGFSELSADRLVVFSELDQFAEQFFFYESPYGDLEFDSLRVGHGSRSDSLIDEHRSVLAD